MGERQKNHQYHSLAVSRHQDKIDSHKSTCVKQSSQLSSSSAHAATVSSCGGLPTGKISLFANPLWLWFRFYIVRFYSIFNIHFDNYQFFSFHFQYIQKYSQIKIKVASMQIISITIWSTARVCVSVLDAVNASPSDFYWKLWICIGTKIVWNVNAVIVVWVKSGQHFILKRI